MIILVTSPSCVRDSDSMNNNNNNYNEEEIYDKYFPYKEDIPIEMVYELVTCKYLLQELDNDIFGFRYRLECSGLKDMMEEDDSHKIIILDLRPKKRYNANHIFGSINFPIDKIGKSRNMFDKYVMNNDEHWKYLFGYSEHFKLVIYDDQCDINLNLKLEDFEKSVYEETISSFDFFLHMLIVYNQKKYYSRYGKKWRDVYFLNGGFDAFSKRYSQYCNSVNVIHSMDKQLNHNKEMADLEIIKDKLYLGNEANIKSYNQSGRLEELNLKCLIDLRNVPDQFPEGVMHLHYPPNRILDYLFNIVLEIDRIKDKLDTDDWIIYVFCESGHGLSAAVIILYIMTKEHKSLREAYLEVYESLKVPLIFSPAVFHYLAKKEIDFTNKKNNKGEYVVNASLPPKFWYLSPYFESSITTCMERVCPVSDTNVSSKNCIIM